MSQTNVADVVRETVEPFIGAEIHMSNCTDIASLLKQMAVPYHYEELPSVLDVSECLQLFDIGRDIMSFCIERDLRV